MVISNETVPYIIPIDKVRKNTSKIKFIISEFNTKLGSQWILFQIDLFHNLNKCVIIRIVVYTIPTYLILLSVFQPSNNTSLIQPEIRKSY